ncbi:MAG TPA: M15 family metallopeptidase [Nakamurella sp.]
MRRVVAATLAAVLGLAGCSGAPTGVVAISSTVAASTVAASTVADPTVAPSPVASPSSTPPTPSPPPASNVGSSSAEPDPPAIPEPSAGTPQAGDFSSEIVTIGPDVAARMTSSWRAGCPVPLTDLRYLTLTYRGFDGADHAGEMVVATSVTDDVVTIFRRLYEIGYPIGSMRLVDEFGGDDGASMSANNTSAFNCRPVTGGGEFSEHAYGTAIDVNPVQNPYVSGSTVLPAQGRMYADRPDSPGVINAGDEVVWAFADQGFSWGGSWSRPIDYQHFSVSGR